MTSIKGRDLVVSPVKIQSDIAAVLQTALERPGEGNADVRVTVQKVQLVARGASVAFLQSNGQAILHVTDVANGADIIAPTAITGNSEELRLCCAIGIIIAPLAEEDYDQTIRGFAEAVSARL